MSNLQRPMAQARCRDLQSMDSEIWLKHCIVMVAVRFFLGQEVETRRRETKVIRLVCVSRGVQMSTPHSTFVRPR